MPLARGASAPSLQPLLPAGRIRKITLDNVRARVEDTGMKTDTAMQVWCATGYGRFSNARPFSMMVAAMSRSAAARAMGVSSSWLAKYGSVTGNRDQIIAALTVPGTVLIRQAGSFTDPYVIATPDRSAKS